MKKRRMVSLLLVLALLLGLLPVTAMAAATEAQPPETENQGEVQDAPKPAQDPAPEEEEAADAEGETAPISALTLAYDLAGGSGETPPAAEYAPDTNLTVAAFDGLAAPEGCDFVAWNTAADGSGAEYAPGAILTLTESTTLYAQYTAPVPAVPDTPAICYMPNGGSGEAFTQDAEEDGRTITVLPASHEALSFSALDQGKAFLGWNTAADGSGDSYAPGDLLQLPFGLTLYAQWSRTAVFHAGDEDGSTFVLTADHTGSVTMPHPDALGFAAPGEDLEFSGWNTAADFSGQTYAPGDAALLAADLDLYAQWLPRYTVTYHSGDEAMTEADAWLPGDTYTILDCAFAAPDAEQVFVGWADAAGSLCFPGDAITISGDLDLTAQWGQPLTITYYPNGASGIPEVRTFGAGSRGEIAQGRDLFAAPAGKTFLYWQTADLVRYDPGNTIPITGSLALFAQWGDTRTLTYYPNGGGGAPVVQAYGQGGSLSIADGSLFAPQVGKVFRGWNAMHQGTGVSYAPGSDFTGLDAPANMALYAQWGDPQITYTVAEGCATLTELYTVGGSPVLLTQEDLLARGFAPPPEGHVLAGWLDADGTLYEPGQSLSPAEARDLALTAQWVPSRTLTYCANSGSGDAPRAQLVAVGQVVTPAEVTPELEGYVFLGWTTDDVIVCNGSFPMPDFDVTLTGSWLPAENTPAPEEQPEVDAPSESEPEADPAPTEESQPEETPAEAEPESEDVPDAPPPGEGETAPEAQTPSEENKEQTPEETGAKLAELLNEHDKDAPIPRELLVTILWRIEQSPQTEPPAEGPFPDVEPDQWYTQAVLWATENRLILGFDDGTFGVGQPVTREQLAVILWRYARWKGCDVEPGEESALSALPDADAAAGYARPALEWACRTGILEAQDGALLPQGSSDRAQTMALLLRYYLWSFNH